MELVTPTKGMIELPREKDLDLFRKVRECAKLLCHSVSCREGEAKRRSASGPCNLHACNGRRITMTMSPCTHQALKLESERLLRS